MKYIGQMVLTMCVIIGSIYCQDTLCRFRNWPFVYPPDERWKYLTGASCYRYTNSDWLNFRHDLVMVYFDGLPFYISLIDDEPVFFDYLNETYVNMIADSFKNEKFLNLWKDCSETAVLCCENELTAENVMPNEEYVCPALWDGWSCWPRARAFETVFNDCPDFIHAEEVIPCSLQSENNCLSDGWEEAANYATCSLTNC